MDEEEESFPSVAKAGISTNSPIGEVAPRNFPAPCVEETLGAASDPGGQQADILQYLITRGEECNCFRVNPNSEINLDQLPNNASP